MRFRQNGNFTEAVTDTPVIAEMYEGTAGVNDKSFVVPSNELWHINFVQAIVTTTATVGNRRMSLSVTNADGNLILAITASATQAASLVRTYTGLQGQFRETSFVNDELQQPIPDDFYITPGSTIRVYDLENIDATDTVVISGSYKRYPGWV